MMGRTKIASCGETLNGPWGKTLDQTKIDRSSATMGKLNPIVVALIAGNMQAAGISLESLDENNTGKDDVVGMFLVSGSDVFQGYVQGNDNKLDRAMISINKVSAGYCKSRGLPVSEGG